MPISSYFIFCGSILPVVFVCVHNSVITECCHPPVSIIVYVPLLCFNTVEQLLITKHCTVAGVSRGKGQDLFLRSFNEGLQLIRERKLQVPSIHAVIVGSDMNAQTKFETELRNFVSQKNIQDRVHFVNKTLTVAPYLASIDVLVQNSQVFSKLLCCLSV